MSIWKVSLWKSIENVLIEMFTNVSWKVPKNGFEMINVEMHLKKTNETFWCVCNVLN